MAGTIQFKRGTAAQWTTANPILAVGEMGIETDTLAYKIGDGTTTWNSLLYRQLSPEAEALLMTAKTVEPSAPASGKMLLYGKKVAGRAMPKFIGPSGLDSILQPFLARNKIGYWCPPGNAATVPGVLGFSAYTAVGTATARNVAATNLFTRMRRLGFVSAGTAGSLASLRQPAAQITLGNGTGLGGFYKIIRFGISDASLVTGARTFIGISSSTSAPTNVNPGTLTNVIGVGHDGNVGDDASFKLYYGGSAAQTPIDLGTNFPANTVNTDAYELALFAPPNSDNIVHYEFTRLNTGHIAAGTLTGTVGVALPAPATLLAFSWMYRTNNLTAAAVGLDIMSDYIETDY